MRLRHLRYIVACAGRRSFSAAARDLNIRQPIISKGIREVEDELGVCLFERDGTGARLTPTGKAFAVSARRILADLERLAERAKAAGAAEERRPARTVVGKRLGQPSCAGTKRSEPLQADT